MSNVFISHASIDRSFVENDLCSVLRSSDVSYWYSAEGIRTSEMWERSILRGLNSCEWFLVVLSPQSATSEWVKDEISWAIQHRGDKIIPILFKPCDLLQFHIRMPRIQYLDWQSDPLLASKTLIKVIKGEIALVDLEPALISRSKRLLSKVDLFSAGAGVGHRMAIMPSPFRGEGEDEEERTSTFEEVLLSFAKLGLGSSPRIADLKNAYSEIRTYEVSSHEGAKHVLVLMHSFVTILDSLSDLVQEICSVDEYKWFRLGRLLFLIPLHVFARDSEKKPWWKRFQRSDPIPDAVALGAMIADLEVPNLIALELRNYVKLVNSGGDFEAVMNKANRLGQTLYGFLK